MCVSVCVRVCMCECVCMCVCVCVCESPTKDHQIMITQFRSELCVEKRFVSVHLINYICVHVLIFLWLLNHTVVS